LSRPEFLTGARNALGQPDVVWYGANGKRMPQEEWDKPHVKCLTVLLSPIDADDPAILVMFNASDHDVGFRLPQGRKDVWKMVVDTAERREEGTVQPGGELTVVARSLIVWESQP
jgi:glycogen operon protein